MKRGEFFRAVKLARIFHEKQISMPESGRPTHRLPSVSRRPYFHPFNNSPQFLVIQSKEPRAPAPGFNFREERTNFKRLGTAQSTDETIKKNHLNPRPPLFFAGATPGIFTRRLFYPPVLWRGGGRPLSPN